MQVPVSTTFLNGLILCDVLNVTAGSEDIDGFDVLTCMTRPHLATDASSEDAMARNVEARATEPGCVHAAVTGCGSFQPCCRHVAHRLHQHSHMHTYLRAVG